MNQIHYGRSSITYMRKDNHNAFYNKKRNYPNAEERQYDDLPVSYQTGAENERLFFFKKKIF